MFFDPTSAHSNDTYTFIQSVTPFPYLHDFIYEWPRRGEVILIRQKNKFRLAN